MKNAKNNNVEAIKEQLTMAKNHVLAVEHSLKHGLNGATFHDLAKAECEVENLESELNKVDPVLYYFYTENIHTKERTYHKNIWGEKVTYTLQEVKKLVSFWDRPVTRHTKVGYEKV